MNRYRVRVERTVWHVIDVDADTELDAKSKAILESYTKRPDGATTDAYASPLSALERERIEPPPIRAFDPSVI